MFTVEDFAGQKSGIMSATDMAVAHPHITSHQFMTMDGSDRPQGLFYTNNHTYGYGILPECCVPCSMTMPLRVKPRPGFEDGLVKTAADDVRITTAGTPHQIQLLTSVEELVEYLNTHFS